MALGIRYLKGIEGRRAPVRFDYPRTLVGYGHRNLDEAAKRHRLLFGNDQCRKLPIHPSRASGNYRDCQAQICPRRTDLVQVQEELASGFFNPHFPILESNVVRLTPRSSAAPSGPLIFQLAASKTSSRF